MLFLIGTAISQPLNERCCRRNNHELQWIEINHLVKINWINDMILSVEDSFRLVQRQISWERDWHFFPK